MEQNPNGTKRTPECDPNHARHHRSTACTGDHSAKNREKCECEVPATKMPRCDAGAIARMSRGIAAQQHWMAGSARHPEKTQDARIIQLGFRNRRLRYCVGCGFSSSFRCSSLSFFSSSFRCSS
jgi:hypothetical protein